MWLPETAVDLETLELLAEFGLRFTILAPHQAARVRRLGEAKWQELKGRRHRSAPAPTSSRLPSGRSIALFFYDGPIARAVAFEGLLSHGDRFIERLTGAFRRKRDGAQLVHVATDGESYGHHHRFGDMALAYVLDQIETQASRRNLTNYGEFLGKTPADRRSRNRREKLLELRPRHRSLVERLRLQLGRPSRLEPGSGARRCATRSTGCATPSRRVGKRRRGRYSTIPGPPATPTSTSSTIDRRKTFERFRHRSRRADA